MELRRRDLIRQLAGAILAGWPARTAASEPSLRPGLCGHKTVEGFEPYCFRDGQGREHQIYVVGRQGPPVLLMHELPGLIDADLDTARRIASRGYTVLAPLLFGEPGGNNSRLADLHNLATLCGKDGFACRHGKLTSPQAVWLRELCRSARQQWTAGKGVGVIGMCLTGAFPLALMSEPSVVAAVLCQPTIPFGLFTHKNDLGLDPTDLNQARKRTDVPVLGLRYTGDGKCPKPRFERLVKEFPSRFYRLDLRGKHHSTIAIDCCPDALEEVMAFLATFVAARGDATFPRHSRVDSRAEVVIDTCDHDTHCALPRQ
jgi:dienelactone hydrolase